MQDVQETAWDQLVQLELRGRVFHREETGDEIYGMVYDVLIDHEHFTVIDDAGRKVASGSTRFGSCRIERNGTINIGIYMVGSIKIFPYGTRLKPS